MKTTGQECAGAEIIGPASRAGLTRNPFQILKSHRFHPDFRFGAPWFAASQYDREKTACLKHNQANRRRNTPG